MLQSYKKQFQLNEPYDAILIGSGLGSLTAAAMMSKEGKRCLVLERHYTPGGYTHVFKRRGYEWDVGVHYVGEVNRPNSILSKLFGYITDGRLEWADMGEVYDRIVIGEQIYDMVKGVNNFKERMIGYFPEEAAAIERYVDLVFQCSRTSRNFYMEKALPPLAARLTGGMMRGPFLKYARRTTREVLEELTGNQTLIKVLTGQYGDYGLPPAESSFAMHAGLVRHYFGGGNYPVGGSSRIFETILPAIDAAGGTVLISAEVQEVLVEDQKAVGVRMADGREFRAPVVISGAGLKTTYGQLLPPDLQEKYHLRRQMEQIRPSVSHICLYVGLKGTPGELRLPKANYWIYPQEGTHEANIQRYLNDIGQEFPVVYVSFPAAKDPDWERRYPNRSTIDIISLMPYDVFQPWEDTPWKKRGAEYEALKEKLARRLLEALFRLEPHLRDHIDHYELSTPITTRHFVNYQHGEIYGLEHTPERFEARFLRPHTPVKQFYLTGQDVISVGIGGALFSGLLTASAVTGKNLIKRIL